MSLQTHPGTTPSAFTRINAVSADLLGIAPEKYAGLLGMAPEHLHDDRYRTPAATNVRLWELMVTRVPWTETALLMTEQTTLGLLGVWDYLITSAPTPLQGLRDAAAYFATVADIGTETLLIAEDEQGVTLTHVNAADLSYEVASAIRAYVLGLLQRRLCLALRKELVPLRVRLATPAPRHRGPLLDLYGTRNVDFECPVSSITFHADDLRGATPHVQPGLSDVLRSHAERVMADSIPLHDWLDLFRLALAEAARGDEATLPATAARLTLSPRTLQRRLEAHGTTWTAEIEAVRRADITRLLRTTDLPLDVVAERNGYADARALRRAVHRWTGHTPTALRRQAARPAT
ncbi:MULTISPECIES: AraC family transcriptional regulator ligand-binding domain-containing protein [unclassified Streptomyces]|uniref:AraC family transcriptional regulator ligand-binding domain-containing protein n=1 Tax=unclassified Streptomyces TaxID=2593676 RepID=UPI002E350086|nr:AraC family transcriptional regulator ligand-binding domain-containing protein [Streptomyces sp. NBC_01268]